MFTYPSRFSLDSMNRDDNSRKSGLSSNVFHPSCPLFIVASRIVMIIRFLQVDKFHHNKVTEFHDFLKNKYPIALISNF